MRRIEKLAIAESAALVVVLAVVALFWAGRMMQPAALPPPDITVPAVSAVELTSVGPGGVSPARTSNPGDPAEAGATAETNLPPATGRLRVHVVADKESRPLADVAILVGRRSSDSPPTRMELLPGEQYLRSARTDAEGRVDFELPADGFYSITALAELSDGWRQTTRWSGVRSDGITDVEISFLLDPRSGWIGTVLDRETGQPIAGATVSLAHGEVSVSTDARGEFHIDASRSWYGRDLYVDAAGYCPVTHQVPEPPDLPYRGRSAAGNPETVLRAHAPDAPLPPTRAAPVFLHRAAFLDGVLLDARDAPIVEQAVQAYPDASRSETQFDIPVRHTDEQGRFDLGRVPSGVLLHVGPTTSDSRSVELILAAGEKRHLILHVQPFVELSGRVLDERGDPVTEGTVRGSFAERSDESTIRADGTYYLPFLGAGAGWVQVTVAGAEPGFTRSWYCGVEIPAGTTEWTFDLHAPRPRSISGRFVDSDGRPIAGATLELDLVLASPSTPTWINAITDAAGRFEFSDLPPGPYDLQGSQSDTLIRSPKLRVQAYDEHIELRLPAVGRLRGRVRSRNGPLAEPASVSVSNATEGFGVQVEDDGSFLTTVPTGTLTVSARSGSSISPSKTIEVRAGEETLVPDMVLEPVATLRVIAGCAAASATFEVLRGQQSCDGGQLTCDADLTLDVPAGNLRLVVHAPGRADESHDISLAPAEHKWLLVLRGP